MDARISAGRGYRRLGAGDPAPWFVQRCTSNPRFTFHTAAGRYLVLCFLGSASDAAQASVDSFVERERSRFDDERFAFFGVSVDPDDLAQARVGESLPGVRWFWDFDGEVSRRYGALPETGAGQGEAYRRLWFVLDPTLRILAVLPFSAEDPEHRALSAVLAALPPPGRFAGIELQAPVLMLPNVFEPDLCQRLVAAYQASGGERSGFMREVDGKTVVVHDHAHKVRTDHFITDPELVHALQARVRRRIVPELRKTHQFEATRMERYLVACYDAETGGHFRAHRDNTTGGTAHRRFAVSINLNAEFDGGDLRFPEYGRQTFRPAPGAAVVFSCGLLHEVTRVTGGRRFAFLPFLYDEAAARQREGNNGLLAEGLGAYRAGPTAAPDS